MSHRTVLLFLATMACGADEAPTDQATTGGQSGTAAPPTCVEVSRAEVLDLAVPADGFSFSAEAVVQRLEGAWLSDGGTADPTLTLDVRLEGPVYGVTSELRSSDGSTTPQPNEPSSGAPGVLCEPTYELTAAVDLDGGDWLTASGEATVSATSPDRAEFSLFVAYAETAGTESPTFDTTEFDEVELGVAFTSDANATRLSLSWHGSSEAPPQATGTATAASPAGVFQAIGSYDLVWGP